MDEDYMANFIARATPLADVLFLLHPRRTNEANEIVVPSMSYWDTTFNDATIRSNFKIYRRLVTPDELSAQHFFMGEVDLVSINSKLQALLDYAVDATEYFDTDEKDLFCPSNVCNSVSKTKKMANEIIRCSSGYFIHNKRKFRNLGKLGGGTTSEIEDMIAAQIRGRLHKWIIDVHGVITKHPRECSEKVYEELARSFFEAFGLGCMNGDAESFALQYNDNGKEKKVTSHPDLLLRQVKPGAPYCAVVEVKSMVVDPDFKHLSAKPEKANIKTFDYDSSEETSSPMKRKETSLSTGSDAPEDKCRKRKRGVCFANDENSTEKGRKTDCAESEPDTIDDESLLSTEIRSLIQPLFCQLYGGVMALDLCQSLLPKKVMGIGVIGFKVIFMSFQQQDDISFSKVCETPGSKIDVYMTRPLSMLSSSDRKEIAKILLQLATENVM